MSATMGSSLTPPNSIFISSSIPLKWVSKTIHYVTKSHAINASNYSKTLVSSTTTEKSTNLGFKNLTETFCVDVQRAEGRPLNVESLKNVGVRIELSNGCVGWGEISVVPLVTVANQGMALLKAKEVCEILRNGSPMTLKFVLSEFGRILPGHELASVRTGFETALIDAVANSLDVPLWRLFGGVSKTLTTAITVPTNSPSEASQLASKYYRLGFNTLKLNMGKDFTADVKVIQALKNAHPNSALIIDGNEQYMAKEAIEVLQVLHDSGITPTILEQPVHRHDWKGLNEVSSFTRGKYRTSISVDESCQKLSDVQRVIREKSANIINVKLAKFGVIGSLEIVEMAKRSGVNLMISSIAETKLGTGFAGHFAAGLGCFKYVGLDSPLFLSEDHVVSGYEASGPVYKFLNARGQGGFLKWDFTSW